jgi:hypothetical protein
MSDPVRSKREREADSIDCDLFRLLNRVESLYQDARQTHRASRLSESLIALRSARIGIRLFMHPDDIERT